MNDSDHAILEDIKKLDKIKDEWVKLRTLNELKAKFQAKSKRIEKLENALQFYADKKSYIKFSNKFAKCNAINESDPGKTARMALL